MKIKELREQLANLSDDTPIVVYWEDGAKQHFFDIGDVSLTKGTPRRDKQGRPGFTFDRKGSAAWAFINIVPE